jgi:RNA polymerase primary sigma factor
LERAGRHRLLTRAEEIRLAKRVARGDQSARDSLVLANLRLVVALAKRYWLPPGSSLAFMDLVQEGTLGLIRAAELFDWRMDAKFSTYAAFWIRQSIGRALALNGVIRVPLAVHRQIRAIARAEQDLKARLGREATDEEIAQAAGIPQLDIAAIRIRTSVLRLDEPLETGGTFADLLTGESDASAVVERELTARALRERVSELPDRLREIVILHYGLAGDPPMSLAQIGRRLGLSRERVRQLEGRALSDLLRRSRSRHFPSRIVDKLRAFDPLAWLATLKAGLLGAAAPAVTTCLVATATVPSFYGLDGPVAPTLSREAEQAFSAGHSDGVPRKPSVSRPSAVAAVGQPAQPAKPPSGSTAREAGTGDAQPSDATTGVAQPVSATAQQAEAVPQASESPTPSTPQGQLPEPQQPGNPESESGRPIESAAQGRPASAPPPTEPVPESQDIGSPDPGSPETSQQSAEPPPLAGATGAERTDPSAHADLPIAPAEENGPPPDAGSPAEPAQGNAPPPDAGPPSNPGQGNGPPPHAGPPAETGQGNGPPPHAGPPANPKQGNGPPATR